MPLFRILFISERKSEALLDMFLMDASDEQTASEECGFEVERRHPPSDGWMYSYNSAQLSGRDIRSLRNSLERKERVFTVGVSAVHEADKISMVGMWEVYFDALSHHTATEENARKAVLEMATAELPIKGNGWDIGAAACVVPLNMVHSAIEKRACECTSK